jgi:Bacterial Ig-like domain (group 3)/MBG domain
MITIQTLKFNKETVMKPIIRKATLMRATTSAIILFLLVTLFVSPAYADSTSLFPGAGANVDTIGTVAWSNPGNITANDGADASASVPSGGGITNYLQGSQFGFTIPAGSSIQGITVAIKRRTTGNPNPQLRDYEVRLVKGGVVVGDNRADLVTEWPHAQYGTVTYGGTSDLWGTTWTAAEVNANDFGVALSARNQNPSNAKNALVDYFQVTIEYSPNGTTTTIDCGGGTPVVTYGSSITCVATVTRSASTNPNTPNGSVSWATNGSGIFTPSSCTASGSGGTATCSVSYTPSSVGSGSHLVTATFAGDVNFNGSSGNQTVTVNKANPTLSVTNSPVTYNGSPQAATVVGSVLGTASNVRYDGSATIPTNAATYAVTADFTPTDTVNYNSLTNATAGNFVINRATPTLSVTNSPVIYNGSPQAATVVGSVLGTVSNVRYDGSATTPTNEGTYAVTADFEPTDTTNYNSLTNASAGNFVINPAGPHLTLVKTSTETTFLFIGDVIHYSYQLTNTGDVTLIGPFAVVDDKVTVICPTTDSLAPNVSITCTASYTIVLADVVNGLVTNTATASGSFDGNPVTSEMDQVTVTRSSHLIYLPTVMRDYTP